MSGQLPSYLHRGGSKPLLGSTIPNHRARIMAKFPDSEAVVSLPQNQRLTYRELEREVDLLARGLLAFGFAPGDRIGIWSTNNLQWRAKLPSNSDRQSSNFSTRSSGSPIP